jgi:hypothetical protein
MYVITKIASNNPRIIGQKLYLANTVNPLWTLQREHAMPFKTFKEAQRMCATHPSECRVGKA